MPSLIIALFAHLQRVIRCRGCCVAQWCKVLVCTSCVELRGSNENLHIYGLHLISGEQVQSRTWVKRSMCKHAERGMCTCSWPNLVSSPLLQPPGMIFFSHDWSIHFSWGFRVSLSNTARLGTGSPLSAPRLRLFVSASSLSPHTSHFVPFQYSSVGVTGVLAPCRNRTCKNCWSTDHGVARHLW